MRFSRSSLGTTKRKKDERKSLHIFFVKINTHTHTESLQEPYNYLHELVYKNTLLYVTPHSLVSLARVQLLGAVAELRTGDVHRKVHAYLFLAIRRKASVIGIDEVYLLHCSAEQRKKRG